MGVIAWLRQSMAWNVSWNLASINTYEAGLSKQDFAQVLLITSYEVVADKESVKRCCLPYKLIDHYQLHKRLWLTAPRLQTSQILYNNKTCLNSPYKTYYTVLNIIFNIIIKCELGSDTSEASYPETSLHRTADRERISVKVAGDTHR